MKKALHKLLTSRYFNSWVVLGIDLITSVCSSMAVLLLREMLAPGAFSRSFITIWCGGAAFFSLFMFLVLRTDRIIIRHSTLREIGKICLAACGKVLLQGIMLGLLLASMSPSMLDGMLLLDLAITICLLVSVRIGMIFIYDMLLRRVRKRQSLCRVLVYGTGDKSVSLVTRLSNSTHYKVMGFLTYGKQLYKFNLSGQQVYYFETEKNLDYLCRRYDVEAVLFAHNSDIQPEQERLVRFCQSCGIKTLLAPTIDEIVDGKPPHSSIRRIKVEDLLCRPEIVISEQEIADYFKNKVFMVTGAAGSIGSELCRQLIRFGAKRIILFDNAETPLHNLRLEFEDRHPDVEFTPVIGDVRQLARLDFVFRAYRPQIVFHAAAYKHVPLMEENPCEAVLVNVIGSRNVADKCIEYGVEKMVMISTDKAVRPTNVMGCTKRLAEIYIQSLGNAVKQGKVKGHTIFATTRFGNVLGSNGSVIPRFTEQIAHGGPVTVTHPEIERFFMTIPEACRLVMEAATLPVVDNRICVFDMGDPVKIVHLAEQMIRLAGFEVGRDIDIEFTGLRPGEKLYEEVLADEEETLRTSHDRIRIAQVREYAFENIARVVAELEALSGEVNIPDTVRLMKRTVPEYISNNSRFEAFDKQFESEEGADRK